jgi:hypothetical protein
MTSPEVVPTLRELVRDHVQDPRSDRELLLWMLLLHSHRIKFRAPVAQGFPDPTSLYPSTQRISAEVIAGIWDEQDEQKRDYRYWYRDFMAQYGSKSEIPVGARKEIEDLRKRLLTDKRVLSIEVE